MKILYYFAQYDGPMYHWQDVHIFDELNNHNIKIDLFNPAVFDSWDEANEKVIKFINENNYDLFMSCANDLTLSKETIAEIKKRIPTLLICFDNLVAPYMHRDTCSEYDLVWLTSFENKKMFEKWGAQILIAPYAANPFFFQPKKVREIEKCAFIGTPYGSRANMINQLVDNEIPVVLFSKKTTENFSQVKSKKLLMQPQRSKYEIAMLYMTYDVGRKLLAAAVKQRFIKNSTLKNEGKYLEYENVVPLNSLSELYSKYAISLASTAARNTGILSKPVGIVNLRSFEIPMCGGIQFCQYNKELSQYFESEKEIIFYNNEHEFIDKARFYLDSKNLKLRINIRKAARRRAENEHTWFCRFRNVFDMLGLKYDKK